MRVKCATSTARPVSEELDDPACAPRMDPPASLIPLAPWQRRETPRLDLSAPTPTPIRAARLERAPDVGDLLARLQRYERAGLLDGAEAAALGLRIARDSSSTERRMFGRMLDELDALDAGRQSPADYFRHALAHAAELSLGNRERFVQLVGMVFSQPTDFGDSSSVGRDILRPLAGGGRHPFGYGIEKIHEGMLAARGGTTIAAGYRADVLDVSPRSTITHHFGELLRVGYNRGPSFGAWCQDRLDGPENPGDVHNGYFAVMLGDALANERISVDDAVALTTWAFTGTAGAPPFSLTFSDYDLSAWLAARGDE